jgi:hypothetical protein
MENRYGTLPFMAALLKVAGVISFVIYWIAGITITSEITKKVIEFTKKPPAFGAPQKLGFPEYVSAYQDPVKMLLFGLILLAGLWALAEALEAIRDMALAKTGALGTGAAAATPSIEAEAENPTDDE